MNKWLFSVLISAGLFAWTVPNTLAAEADEEQTLIEVLQSKASLAQKDAACARLKMIGTGKCVPALAALLTDEQLSHSARYALEPMRFDQAGAALVEALNRTTGLVRVGIIDSLAARDEKRAVPALVKLIRDADPATTTAAAEGLGAIGGPEATKALRNGARSSTGTAHAAAVDGLLRCANRMVRSGERSAALAIFEQLDLASEPDSVRVAAFRGRVRASGNAGLGLVLHAISGHEGPEQLAAIQLVRELPMANTTKEITSILPRVSPVVQVALVGSLAQRGDPSALPTLTNLAAKSGPEVQLAIIHALDLLGDASVAGMLSSFAASGVPEQRKAARLALADIHRGDVTQGLLDQLGTGSPQVQAEAARALGARGDKAAVSRLTDLAQHAPDSTRKAALQALSVLSDDSQLASLVDLVVNSKDQTGRAEAAEAVNSAYLRLQTSRGHVDAGPLVQGIEKGSPEARIALLPVCSGVNDIKARAVLRTALHDQHQQVQAAAVRALSDTSDTELLADLVQLAATSQEESSRTLAIDGAVRLVGQDEAGKLEPRVRVATLSSLLRAATMPEQKRKVLAGLAEVPDPKALQLVDTVIDDPNLKNEAARAAVKIASTLPNNQADACTAVLDRALAGATDPATRQAVQAALKQIQDSAEYLTTWQVAGPYRQADKDYSALFDIAFPPEMPGGSDEKWKALPPGSDPKRPFVMDLLKVLGGEQCVAYARTWIHSDQDREAVLELGSDDGVKIWLNEKQVYALNVARPLQLGSDKVNVTLKSGWNPLLLKITQNNLGWEFCVRIHSADGSHLEGLRCDSAPKTISAN